MAIVSCKASKGDLCFLREEHSSTTIQGETSSYVDYLPGIVRSVARNGRVLSFETVNGTIRRAPKGGAFQHLVICRQLDLTEPTEKILRDVPQSASIDRLRQYMLHYRRTSPIAEVA